ncbi:hypothetical protein [Pedobacter agri]|uniref:hypothetical protein n=1 Tax=Pedobacter agri TaxID=454586 RepID=UPI002931F41B|nr:hypothetical protein [Pedobacter agri]
MNDLETLITELEKRHGFKRIGNSKDNGIDISDNNVVVTLYNDLSKKIHTNSFDIERKYLGIISGISAKIKSNLLVQASLLIRSGNFKESPDSLFEVESLDNRYSVLLVLENDRECQKVIGDTLTELEIKDANKLIEKIFNLGM